MNKIIYLIIAAILISISNIYCFLYLNLLNMNYTILDYLLFILKRIECLLIIPGILIIYFTLNK